MEVFVSDRVDGGTSRTQESWGEGNRGAKVSVLVFGRKKIQRKSFWIVGENPVVLGDKSSRGFRRTRGSLEKEFVEGGAVRDESSYGWRSRHQAPSYLIGRRGGGP